MSDLNVTNQEMSDVAKIIQAINKGNENTSMDLWKTLLIDHDLTHMIQSRTQCCWGFIREHNVS